MLALVSHTNLRGELAHMVPLGHSPSECLQNLRKDKKSVSLCLQVEKWEAINPHLLFYSFLPPLIFSEAMKLNVRLVQKCFAQATNQEFQDVQ